MSPFIFILLLLSYIVRKIYIYVWFLSFSVRNFVFFCHHLSPFLSSFCHHLFLLRLWVFISYFLGFYFVYLGFLNRIWGFCIVAFGEFIVAFGVFYVTICVFCFTICVFCVIILCVFIIISIIRYEIIFFIHFWVVSIRILSFFCHHFVTIL